MKTKLKFLACFALAILQQSTMILSSVTAQTMHNPEYLPITSYQDSLSDAISKFLAKYIYKKNKVTKIGAQAHKNAIVAEQNKIIKLSREQAIEAMKQITTKLFDSNDSQHISMYLNDMKDLIVHLDDILDKKTIAAIHFLIKNQHRSSPFEFLFWAKAIKEKELDTAIPTTAEVANKAGAEKLMILQKKMKLPVAAQIKTDQSVDQPVVVVV